MKNGTAVTGPDLRARAQAALDTKPHLREMLFPFGFLITSAEDEVQSEGFPFYAKWPCVSVGRYQIHHHQDQKLFLLESDVGTLFLLGHAYDPISMVHDENCILELLRDGRRAGHARYIDALNQLTGIFVHGVIEGEQLSLYGDAAGMQTVFYGEVDGSPYVTSHAAIVGSLCSLDVTDYVSRLTEYRFYHLFGRALPGDLSPYDELRRLVPNHCVSWDGAHFSNHRFYPVDTLQMADTHATYEESVQTAADILTNSMTLAAKKWQMPAISLTGGCDSQTTLACADGNYDDFRYFSYISSPAEEVDAAAAKVITDSLGLQHDLIQIATEEISRGEDFEDISTILEMNYGNIGPAKPSEVAKRIALRESDIQVEIKSWVSEVVRGYYHKRFRKNRFPERPTARYLTTLYKVFLHDREMVRQTDAIFEDYLARYLTIELQNQIDWWDIFFWEFHTGSLNGRAITGEHRLSFGIDIPYNNRLLISALLATPIQDRVADRPHRDIRELSNPAINRVGISVVNVKHTKARARAERAYLELHTRWPL